MSQQVGYDPQAFSQQTGRESHHWHTIPEAYRNIPGIQQWANDPNSDPNAKVQEYLTSIRASGKVDEGDAQALGGGRQQSLSGSAGGGSPFTGQIPVQQYPNQLGMVQGQPRNTALWDQLVGRAQQTLNVGANDPIIRNQVDAYAAQEERARRNYMSDVAERSGPIANLRGEQRMSSERMGQRVGMLQTQLMGRELEARRAEIQAALAQMGDMNMSDERLALQRELQLLELALRQQLGQNELGIRQSQIDLDSNRLGLEAEDRASYWDWIRSGGRLG